MNKLTGMLLYVCINKPAKAYIEKGQPPRPDEWKASLAITDEDVVDAYEEFAKGINAKTSVKKVKTSEFEGIYKVAPPEDAGKNVWVITLKKSTKLGKTDKDVPDLYKPKVFEKVGSTLVDVTNSKLPANGSLGSISIDKFERSNGTASLYLKNVLVTKMIEYVAQEAEYNPGDEFGEEGAAPAKVEKPAKEAKPAKAPKAEAAAEDDEDMPF